MSKLMLLEVETWSVVSSPEGSGGDITKIYEAGDALAQRCERLAKQLNLATIALEELGLHAVLAEIEVAG